MDNLITCAQFNCLSFPFNDLMICLVFQDSDGGLPVFAHTTMDAYGGLKD